MGPRKGAGQQKESSKNQFVSWDSDAMIRKRKREDSGLAEIETSSVRSDGRLQDQGGSYEIQILSPHMLSKVPILDDGFSNLPELTYTEPMPPHNIERLPLDEPQDLPGDQPHECEAFLPSHDALFSMHLRSRSSSYFLKQDNEHDETPRLKTVPLNDVRRLAELDLEPADSIRLDAAASPKYSIR